MRFTLGCVLLLGACGGGDSDSDADEDTGADLAYDWTAPDAAGFHIVATELDSTEGPGGVELPLQIWYPATDVSDTNVVYDGFAPGTARASGTPACEAPRPVVVFSHGNSGMRFQSYFYAEFMASHGYMVLAMDHTGNTYSDMSVPVGEMALRRPFDVSMSFDHLVQRAGTAGDPLEGCVDPAAGYAITGHSFGGFTTLAVAGAELDIAGLEAYCDGQDGWLCQAAALWRAEHPDDDLADLSDDRVWAAVPWAPAGYELLAAGLPHIEVPTLVIVGDVDLTFPLEAQSLPIFEALDSGGDGLMDVRDAGHYSFTDFCDFLPATDGCGSSNLDLERAHELTNTATVAWLDVVRGEQRSAPWIPLDVPEVSWTASP